MTNEENTTNTGVRKAQERLHIDNTTKSGFNALDSIGKSDSSDARCFTYVASDGSQKKLPIVYPEVSYVTNFLLNEDLPGIYHSSFAIDNFYFADRIDEFAVVDPGVSALFVDVGAYDLCGVEFLDEALARTGTAWEDANVFLTHSHDDHDGNLAYCLDRGAKKVFMKELHQFGPNAVQEILTQWGVARAGESELSFYIERLVNRYERFKGYEDRITFVCDGDAIDVGDYHLEVIETPGHTASHLCLIEREKGILFAGDHVLDTAPGIMSFTADVRQLQRFLANLAYLKSLDLERVFMCHHEPLIGETTINAFIEKIIASYDRPINKMFTMLEVENPLTVNELAQKYYFYLPSWDDQPPILQVRRLAIAFSYLEYLYDMGKAERQVTEDGVLLYALK